MMRVKVLPVIEENVAGNSGLEHRARQRDVAKESNANADASSAIAAADADEASDACFNPSTRMQNMLPTRAIHYGKPSACVHTYIHVYSPLRI